MKLSMSPKSQMRVLKAHSRQRPYLTVIDAIRLLEIKDRAIRKRRIDSAELAVNKDHLGCEIPVIVNLLKDIS